MSNEETKATEYLQHGTFNIKNYEQMIEEGNCLVRVMENSEEYRSSVCKLRQSPPRKSAPPELISGLPWRSQGCGSLTGREVTAGPAGNLPPGESGETAGSG